jgi:ATP-binding cassette, subfamily C, bacteriocin exporter
MRKIPAIKQRDVSDCGVSCLAAVLRYYGTNQSISQLRQVAGTDQRGTNLLGLSLAAEANGLQARAVRGTADSLQLVPAPAIIHMVLPSGLHHYMVLVKAAAKQVKLMDPAEGRFRKMATNDFLVQWSGVLVLLSPKADFSAKQKAVSTFSRFVTLARPLRNELFQTLLGAIVVTILGFSTAIYIQKLVDDIIEQNNKGLLHILGICMLLVLLMQTIIGVIKSLIGFRTGQVFDARLISGYFRHLFNLPQQFFDTMRVGEIVSRINDAVKIRLFVNEIAMGIMLNLLIVVFSISLLSFYFWKLAVMVMAICPVYAVIHWITTTINRKWQRKLMEQSADLESQLVESLTAASTVKRLAVENHFVDKIEASFLKLMQTAFKSGLYNLYIGSFTEFINRSLTIAVLWVGGWLVMQKQLSAGELLSFYALVGYFTAPVAALITSGKGIQDGLIAADRLFEITDLDTEFNTAQPGLQLQPGQINMISFAAVSFRYGTRAIVLNDLSIDFKQGEITAVVGESGCGKSTILHLLQNLYPVQAGSITIATIPIQHYCKKSLRSRIGVVPQKVELFSGTITENIAVGENLPDMDRIVALCQQVGAAEFINLLPGGYYCTIGEKGANLSGGQQQKLAIARALYPQPDIFIMDEATASLDPVSEMKIKAVLGLLKAAGKTVILIAHRLTTIAVADTVHVIQNGGLLITGGHTELLASSSYYASLWADGTNRPAQH